MASEFAGLSSMPESFRPGGPVVDVDAVEREGVKVEVEIQR